MKTVTQLAPLGHVAALAGGADKSFWNEGLQEREEDPAKGMQECFQDRRELDVANLSSL